MLYMVRDMKAALFFVGYLLIVSASISLFIPAGAVMRSCLVVTETGWHMSIPMLLGAFVLTASALGGISLGLLRMVTIIGRYVERTPGDASSRDVERK